MSEENNTFSIPEGLVEKIYELSGDTDKYKGLIMIAANESGDPVIYSKFDSAVMEMALIKAMENFLIRMQKEDDKG